MSLNFLSLFDSKKHAKIKTPNRDGISEVNEDTSKNPHNPIRIKEIEFIMLVLFVFISNLYLKLATNRQTYQLVKLLLATKSLCSYFPNYTGGRYRT
jgi:hypothetical protein